jgi:DNA polymerase I-like protein with 3'-5' exonuclease and polymerase domains
MNLIPDALPDLRRVGLMAIDSEEHDKGLQADRGSSWPWRDGHVCGISAAYRADGKVHGLYLPMRHPDSQCFPVEQTYNWLAAHVASEVRFLNHNGGFDWGWFRSEAGIRMPPSERIEELGALATLTNENRRDYGLDALASSCGLPGKDESLLREGCAALGLIENKRKKFRPQSYLWRLPARYVATYAVSDAVNTLLTFEQLDPILDRENTRAAYQLDRDLVPMIVAMRARGIRVDIAAAERARDMLLGKRDTALASLSDKLGMPVDMSELNRSRWKVEVFDREQVRYPRTEKGNPSFTSDWMEGHAHWLPQLICTAEKYHRAGDKFVGKYILEHAVNGRIYAELHPFKSEDHGTKSFRFSYSDPPLQQMTAHDEEFAPIIRKLFLPDEHEWWAKSDASQQEFRFVAHYAAIHNMPKAEITVARYRDDPDTDFHKLTAQLTGLRRQEGKQVNFAKIYGAGVRKFAEMTGLPINKARQLFEQYDREMPFLRALSKAYEYLARHQGYITLYDGARRHFNLWVPAGKWAKGAGPCSREEAEHRLADPKHPWFGKGQLYRADCHNALNCLIQGSAARHTKLWMRLVWREGIVPLLQMHDSLDCSVATREQAEIVARLCVEAVQLKVPMRCDLRFGRSWGDAKHAWDELQSSI